MSEPISQQAHVARGATFIFIQGIVNAILGVVYVWFLLHTEEIAGQVLFTESDLGFYTMLSFLMTLMSTIGVLALRAASVRYISHYLASGEEEKARSVVTRILQVTAITSISIIALLVALSGFLADTFASSLLIFQLLPISSALQVFYFQTQAFLQGVQKIRELAIIGMFYTVAQYSVSTFLVYSGLGVLGAVIGWVVALSLSFSIGLSVVFRRISPSKHPHNLRALLTFSFPIYVSAILTLLMNWVDQVMLYAFLSQDALGVYSLAVRASVVPNLVAVAIISSLFPKLSEIRSVSGTKSLGDAFKASTRYAALIGFPLSLMVATLAYPIIILFATVRFADAVVPLAIMCVASIPAALGAAIFPTLFTMDRTKRASLITIVVIALEAIFSYASLAYFNAGLPGVAFSRLSARLASFIMGTYALGLVLKTRFDKEAIWKSAAAALAMVLSLLTLELVRGHFAPSSYQFLVLRIRQLPIYIVVGSIVYVFSLIALKALKAQDMELLKDYLPTRARWIVKLLRRISRLED